MKIKLKRIHNVKSFINIFSGRKNTKKQFLARVEENKKAAPKLHGGGKDYVFLFPTSKPKRQPKKKSSNRTGEEKKSFCCKY